MKRNTRVFNRKRGGLLSWLENLSIMGWLILANVIFFFVLLLAGFRNDGLLSYVALKPESILQGKYLWTLISHMFVHGGFGHLFINMFVLFSLGGLSERIIGRKRFFWFYILSGIFAGLLSVFLAGFFGSSDVGARIFGRPEIFMVGASGAIFAIAGLFVMLLPRLRFAIIFFPFFSFPAYVMVPAVLFLTWGLSIWFEWPIGNVAHFGGFLAGIGYGYYLRQKYRRKVAMLQKMFK